jgi:hypothetical protein
VQARSSSPSRLKSARVSSYFATLIAIGRCDGHGGGALRGRRRGGRRRERRERVRGLEL